jgi:hypothetical protein
MQISLFGAVVVAVASASPPNLRVGPFYKLRRDIARLTSSARAAKLSDSQSRKVEEAWSQVHSDIPRRLGEAFRLALMQTPATEIELMSRTGEKASSQGWTEDIADGMSVTPFLGMTDPTDIKAPHPLIAEAGRTDSRYDGPYFYVPTMESYPHFRLFRPDGKVDPMISPSAESPKEVSPGKITPGGSSTSSFTRDKSMVWLMAVWAREGYTLAKDKFLPNAARDPITHSFMSASDAVIYMCDGWTYNQQTLQKWHACDGPPTPNHDENGEPDVCARCSVERQIDHDAVLSPRTCQPCKPGPVVGDPAAQAAAGRFKEKPFDVRFFESKTMRRFLQDLFSEGRNTSPGRLDDAEAAEAEKDSDAVVSAAEERQPEHDSGSCDRHWKWDFDIAKSGTCEGGGEVKCLIPMKILATPAERARLLAFCPWHGCKHCQNAKVRGTWHSEAGASEEERCKLMTGPADGCNEGCKNPWEDHLSRKLICDQHKTDETRCIGAHGCEYKGGEDGCVFDPTSMPESLVDVCKMAEEAAERVKREVAGEDAGEEEDEAFRKEWWHSRKKGRVDGEDAGEEDDAAFQEEFLRKTRSGGENAPDDQCCKYHETKERMKRLTEQLDELKTTIADREMAFHGEIANSEDLQDLRDEAYLWHEQLLDLQAATNPYSSPCGCCTEGVEPVGDYPNFEGALQPKKMHRWDDFKREKSCAGSRCCVGGNPEDGAIGGAILETPKAPEKPESRPVGFVPATDISQVQALPFAEIESSSTPTNSVGASSKSGRGSYVGEIDVGRVGAATTSAQSMQSVAGHVIGEVDATPGVRETGVIS